MIKDPKENLKAIILEAVEAIENNIKDYKLEQTLKIRALQDVDIETCKVQYEANWDNYKIQQGPQGTKDVFDTFEGAANDLVGKNFGVVFAFVKVGDMRVYTTGADVEEYNKGKKKIVSKIRVNLWNDYFDDEDIPEGKSQETYMYVEDSDVDQEDAKNYLEFLLDHIFKNVDIGGAVMVMRNYDSKEVFPALIGTENESMLYERWEILISDLTHKDRERIVEELKESKLEYKGIPFHIYSES